MDMLAVTHLLAATSPYGCDAYGAGSYGTCSTVTETDTTTSTPPKQNDGSSLANTGFDILLPLVLGVILIVAAIIYWAKRLRKPGKRASRTR